MLKIEKYIIKPESQAIGRFNLYEETNVKDKDGKETGRINEKSVAYAITLGRAIEIIAEEKAIAADLTDVKEYIKAKEDNIKVLIIDFNKQNKAVYKELMEG